MVTAFRLRSRLSVPDRGSDGCSRTGAVSSDLTKVKTPVWWAHRRVKSLGRALGGEYSTRLAGARVVTAVRLRSRLSVPDRGSDGCLSTT